MRQLCKLLVLLVLLGCHDESTAPDIQTQPLVSVRFHSPSYNYKKKCEGYTYSLGPDTVSFVREDEWRTHEWSEGDVLCEWGVCAEHLGGGQPRCVDKPRVDGLRMR